MRKCICPRFFFWLSVCAWFFICASGNFWRFLLICTVLGARVSRMLFLTTDFGFKYTTLFAVSIRFLVQFLHLHVHVEDAIHLDRLLGRSRLRSRSRDRCLRLLLPLPPASRSPRSRNSLPRSRERSRDRLRARFSRSRSFSRRRRTGDGDRPIIVGWSV